MGILGKNTFISSLNLPEGITAYRYDGMDRVHFKYYGKGFLVIDMKNDCYNLSTREKYLRDVGIQHYEVTESMGPNRALLRDISYENTDVLYRLIAYVTNDMFYSPQDTIDINTPMKPKNRLRKPDGTIRYVCGRCEASFSKAPRCPECGQLAKE